MDWMSLWTQLSPTFSGGGSPAPSWEASYPGGYSSASPLPNPRIPDESRFWAGPSGVDRLRQGAQNVWNQVTEPNPNVLPNATFNWRGGY